MRAVGNHPGYPQVGRRGNPIAESIFIRKKLFARQAAKLFEAAQRRINLSTSRPDEIRIETHAAKASFAP
jgi:hypothetical protein